MRKLVSLIALAFAASSLLAQQSSSPDDALLDRLYAVRAFHETAISPDGRHLAWSRSSDAAAGAIAHGSSIFVTSMEGDAKPMRVTAGQGSSCDERDLAWSPDSSTLAFLSDAAKKGQRELYLAKAGAPPHKLTSLTGYLSQPHWSPDGKKLAILFIENAKRAAGPLVAMSRDEGVVEEHIYEQRIAVIDIAGGKYSIVTPADTYIYEFDWAPDSKRIAAIAAPGSGDNNYWIARLAVIDTEHAATEMIYSPKLQIADPHWSDDGKQIAFIEGLMSDQGSTGGDIEVIAADGSELRDATPAMKASATTLLRFEHGAITFGEEIDGESALGRVDVASGRIETIWHGEEVITARGLVSASIARDGKTSAVIRSSFGQAPEVWAGPIGNWKRITSNNASIKAEWGSAKSIHWTNDGLQVQGWLLLPSGFDPAKKYPMIVNVHGGPASGTLARWPHEESALLSKRGYFVFFPNPRGSYGEGESFTQGNVKDFGYGDLRDILSGVDAVRAAYPVDDARVGVWGWSYGGYMTMWAVTQTNRFKAAVAGAGLSNWQSYYGENDIDQWMIPYFGASVYDDPAVYAKSSPITFIKKVQTPTLILVGERDGEVPAPQSYEFWHALKALNVPTQLVVYPDEGHHFVKAEHARDVVRRVVTWFDQYLAH